MSTKGLAVTAQSTLTVPDDEEQRLASLQRYEILDTPPDGAFDRVARLVAELMNVPVALVSLVDHDRIWFKSHHGLDVQQVNRDPGLCASAILGKGMYEVSDARLDPRTLTNPLVRGEFGLRFYAGHPLTTASGHNLGVLCALDFEPREITDQDRHVLSTMSSLVMDQMELRLSVRRVNELNAEYTRVHRELQHQIMHDSLTGLWNRGAVLAFLSHSLNRSRRSTLPVTALMIDVDLFKSVNDTYGHAAGDQVLVETSQRILNALRTSDAVGRVGGEEFLVVLDDANSSAALTVAERIRHAICDTPMSVTSWRGEDSIKVTASIGAHCTESMLDLPPHLVLSRADAALYQAKRLGRNRVEID